MSTEVPMQQTVEAVPLEHMASHLRLNPAPIPSHSALSTSPDLDGTRSVPSQYLPPSLRFPSKLSGSGVRGHFYISLDNHPDDYEQKELQGDNNQAAARYFLEESVAERERARRAKERLDKAEDECKTM